jgi:hypothetical protein
LILIIPKSDISEKSSLYGLALSKKKSMHLPTTLDLNKNSLASGPKDANLERI